VLIDEVGELPAAMQVKLLRVLESRQVTRVGALRARSIDVRFVGATNRISSGSTGRSIPKRSLLQARGHRDLVPALRERKSDIEPLIDSFLKMASTANGRAQPQISQAALQALLDHSWPGNVRELRHAVERAVLLASDEIGVEHLPPSKGMSPRSRRAVRRRFGRRFGRSRRA